MKKVWDKIKYHPIIEFWPFWFLPTVIILGWILTTLGF